MSALPPKADLLGRHEKRLRMTQSGHLGGIEIWRLRTENELEVMLTDELLKAGDIDGQPKRGLYITCTARDCSDEA